MAEPPITLRAAHDSGRANLPPTRYVVHCTAGGRGYPKESAVGVARNTALYFQKQASGGSAHYIHDAGGAEEHCVPEDTIAWHAPPNQHSIGDEICAEPTYTREQWLSPQVWPAVAASAVRCREVCDRRGIPKVKLSPADLLAGKSGICGHVDVSQAWRQSTHWDPGPNFPWDRYMAEVNRTGPTTPVLEDPDMRLARTPDGTIWLVTDTDVAAIGDPALMNSLIKVWGLPAQIGADDLDRIAKDATARARRQLGNIQQWVWEASPPTRGGPWPIDRLAGVDDKTGAIGSELADAAKRPAGQPVAVDASAVAASLAGNPDFLAAIGSAVVEDAVRRLTAQ